MDTVSETPKKSRNSTSLERSQNSLETTGIGLEVCLSHLGAQFGMILLKFGRCFGKENNDTIYGTGNGTHEEDTANDKSYNETNAGIG